jgi:hypothetical protein
VTALEQATYSPLYRTAPVWGETDGDLAVQLALDMGWTLDEVQRWQVDANLAVGADGLPACRETAILGPRQTVGKTVALEVCALFDVFLADVPLHVWTAHLYSTAQKTYLDLKSRIMRSRDYATRCEFRDGNTGGQAIIVDDERLIEFHARSGKGGRGFTTSRLTLDEWLFGRPGDLGALAPTIVTMRDAQIRYASSGGKAESTALRDVVTRGRAGSSGLAYVELGAPREPCEPDGDTPPANLADSRCRHPKNGDQSCALNRRHLWWHANSGLWSGRIREADVAQQRQMLSALEFAREFLTWHEFPEHEDDDGGAFDMDRFADLAAPDLARGRPVHFGVATAPDRSWCAVAVAWRRPGGGVHVTVVDYRPHTSWVRDRVAVLRRSWGGTVVVDSRSRDLIADAREPAELDQALAEAALSDAVIAGTLSHGNEPELWTAASAAVWRQTGPHRRLESSGRLDVSPARAAALAVHAASQSVDPLQQVW